MLGRDRRHEAACRAGPTATSAQERDARHEAAGEDVDAEDRRVPVRRERHHPVEGGEGGGERERDQERARCSAAGARRPRGRAARSCRRDSPRAQSAMPDQTSEVEGRARQEEGHVQVRLLPAQERVVRHRLRVAPVVERVQAQQHRDEEQREERQRRGGVLGEAPHDDPPAARHRGVDQHEEEAAERDRQEEERRRPATPRPAGPTLSRPRANARSARRPRRRGPRRARAAATTGARRGPAPAPAAVSRVVASLGSLPHAVSHSSREAPAWLSSSGVALGVEARVPRLDRDEEAVVARALEAGRRRTAGGGGAAAG